MNKTTMLIVATLSMAAMPLYAVDEHHPEKTQGAAVPAPAASQSEVAADRQIGQAQETMRKLQEQMRQIRLTGDSKERRKLMDEHMQTMQEGMKQLRGMSGMKKPGGMMMGGDGRPGGMMKMHDMMDMRMEMMETMMEQMMQREEMRDSMKK